MRTLTNSEPEVITDAVRLGAIEGTDSLTGRNFWADQLGVKVGVDWRGIPSVSAADAARIKRAWDEAYTKHSAAQAAYDHHLRLRAEDARRKRLEAQREAAEHEALRATASAAALSEAQRQRAAEAAEANWRREQQRLGEPPSFDQFQAHRDRHEAADQAVQDQLAHEEAAKRKRLAAQRGN